MLLPAFKLLLLPAFKLLFCVFSSGGALGFDGFTCIEAKSERRGDGNQAKWFAAPQQRTGRVVLWRCGYSSAVRGTRTSACSGGERYIPARCSHGMAYPSPRADIDRY